MPPLPADSPSGGERAPVPGHGHDHGPGHNHGRLPADPEPRLLLSLALNAIIPVVQVIVGLSANSLGLISDAAHNLSDCFALGLSYGAARAGRRPATPRRTFAYKRVEILVALINSAVLLGVCVSVTVEAVRRLFNQEPVNGVLVMIVAAGALVVNVAGALLLRGFQKNLNVRSAFFHLLSDAFTSLSVVIGGLFVYLLSWYWVDSALSIALSLWMAWQAWGILKSSVNVLMEGTPESLSVSQIDQALREVPGVRGVHDLHVWAIASEDFALSAHVEIDDTQVSEVGGFLAGIKQMLQDRFEIGHATLEVELSGGLCAGSACVLDLRALAPPPALEALPPAADVSPANMLPPGAEAPEVSPGPLAKPPHTQ